jgi:hypothetical protein
MNTIRITAGKTVARTAMLAAVAGIAAIAFAGPASAEDTLLYQNIDVPDCGSTGQVCGVVPTFEFFTLDREVSATYVNGAGCSDIDLTILVDGQPAAPPERLAPSTYRDLSLHVKLGEHKMGVLAVGVTGGCNTGRLASYSGRLQVSKD